MSYQPPQQSPANTVWGNNIGISTSPVEMPLNPSLSYINGQLSANPQAGTNTNGNYTLQATDAGTSIVSQSVYNNILTLPAGLPAGFTVQHYQGNRGQTYYVPGTGATLSNGSARSQSYYINGTCAVIKHLGSNVWQVSENFVPGQSVWNISGSTTANQGDTASFVINPPDTWYNQTSATIQVTGSGFSIADRSLISALNEINGYDPLISFDGVNTLTLTQGCRNPIPLVFFIPPTYSGSSPGTLSITISSPSFGSLGNATQSCTINANSGTLNPSSLFPVITETVASTASSGQNQITLNSVANLLAQITTYPDTSPSSLYPNFMVTGSANIPANTWVTNITGNVITLNNNLTGNISSSISLSFQSPGMWLDFSTSQYSNVSNPTATYYNSAGHLTTTAYNTPRFDYNPSTLTLLGLLYEAGSYNQFSNSNLSGWTTTNTTITLNNATSPDGTSDATLFSSNSGTAQHNILNPAISAVVTSGTSYTYSVYLKAGTETVAQLTFNTANFPSGYANFNLSAGTIGNTSVFTAAMVNVGNGWYRCSITGTCSLSHTNTAVGYIAFTHGSTTVTRLPSVVGGQTMFVYGAQLEIGLVATSLMPVSGGIAGRPNGDLSFAIPGGTTSITVTFDDASTQNISVTPNTTYHLTTALNRPHIVSITGTGISYSFTGGSLPVGTAYATNINNMLCGTVTDKVSGLNATQTLSYGNLPTYATGQLNNLGGLEFNSSSLSLFNILPNAVSTTLNGAWTAATFSFTVTSAAGISVGYLVSGTSPTGVVSSGSIVSGVVTAISGTTITVSNDNAHQTVASGTAIYFYPPSSNPLVNILDYGANSTSKAMIFAVASKSSLSTSTLFQNSNVGFWPAFSGQTANNNFIWGASVYNNNWYYSINGGEYFPIISTLTADTPSSSYKNYTVDDTTGITSADWMNSSVIQGGYNIQVTVNSTTTLTAANNLGNPGLDQPIGTQILTWSSPAQTSSGGKAGNPSAFFKLGGFTGTLYELIVIPYWLSEQQRRGVVQYLANKWGATAATTTASSNVSAGSTFIPVASTAGLAKYMLVNGTGLPTGCYVLGVNTSGSYIRIDKPVLSGGVSSGATLTFTNPGYQPKSVLDITQFYPTFREDFCNGIELFNPSTNRGLTPYYPFGTAGSYQTYNNGETAFLNVLNKPVLPYDPFTTDQPALAPDGEAVFTTFNTPASLSTLLTNAGYTVYSQYGGYLDARQVQSNQYVYYEGRLRYPANHSAWCALWTEASNGKWPPEIDFAECLNTGGIAACPMSLHTHAYNKTGPMVNSNPNTLTGNGWVQNVYDATQTYGIWGVEVDPVNITFYVNREKQYSIPTPWDFHLPTYMVMDNDSSAGTLNGVQVWHIDYIGAWVRNRQTPTIPTSTQPETTALLAAMTVQPSSARETLINTLIASLKSYTTSFGQTLWQALDFLFIPAAHAAQAGLIDWKNPSIIGTTVGSPVYTTDRGYTGTYNSSYIDTGINLSTASGFGLTQLLNHIGVIYSSVNATSNNFLCTNDTSFTLTTSSSASSGQNVVPVNSAITQSTNAILSSAISGQNTITFYNAANIVSGMAVSYAPLAQPFLTGWTQINSPYFVLNFVIDPNGAMTATRITPSTTVSYSGAYTTFSTVIGNSYTQTVYLKMVTGSATEIQVGYDGNNLAGILLINPSTMQVISAGSGVIQYASQSVGNGWYQFCWTWIASNTTSDFTVYNVVPANCEFSAWGMTTYAGSYTINNLPVAFSDTVASVTGNVVTLVSNLPSSLNPGTLLTFTSTSSLSTALVGEFVRPATTGITNPTSGLSYLNTVVSITAVDTVANTITLSSNLNAAIASSTHLIFSNSFLQVGQSLGAVGTQNFYVQPLSGGTEVVGQTYGPLPDITLGGGVAQWNCASPTYNPWNTPLAGHFVGSRNYIYMTAYNNGKFCSIYPSYQSNNTLPFDNANVLIANGPDACLCVHAGVYLTPDDVQYLYTLLYNYLHAIGAL